MAAQKGKDLLVKIDSAGTGTFTTIAGLRSRSVAFNAATVDTTNQDSLGQWRELLAGVGIRSARITGEGIFKDASSDAALRAAFFDGLHPNLQIVIPDFGTLEGTFHIAALEYSGRHDGELGFEIGLESAGPLSFLAM
ncbi:MAG: phage major tail protein, TP901-1 family [Hyphomicrobiaceae bacterium]